MTKKQLSARLRKVRRELDECSEWIERLADDVDTPTTGKVALLGMTEAAEVSGLQYRTFQQRYTRGTTPTPVAVLACGPIWARADIERWAKRAA
jgi:predicted DNA-binding transcriptional regulator AlpA